MRRVGFLGDVLRRIEHLEEALRRGAGAGDLRGAEADDEERLQQQEQVARERDELADGERHPARSATAPAHVTKPTPIVPTENSSGNAFATVRRTVIPCSSSARFARRNRSVSNSSRANARTTRTPATFSCSTVLSAASRTWDSLNIGPRRRTKTKSTPIVAGRTTSASTASVGSSRTRKTTAPTSSSDRRDDLHETAAHEVAHQVDVARDARDELPGLGAVVVGEAQPLQLVEDLVAHVERRAVAGARREVALQEAREAACRCDSDEEHRVSQDHWLSPLDDADVDQAPQELRGDEVGGRRREHREHAENGPPAGRPARSAGIEQGARTSSAQAPGQRRV